MPKKKIKGKWYHKVGGRWVRASGKCKKGRK